VSDLVTTARTARESLARGLGALQSDPQLHSSLSELAAPIAQAMGALHAIERSGGSAIVPNAEVALNHTRAALAQLQTHASSHPAIAAAAEAVAASLGLVHSLTRTGKSGAPPPQQLGYAPTVAAAAVSQPLPASRGAFRPGAAGPPEGSALAATYASSSMNPPAAPMPSGEVPIVNADLGTASPTNFYKGLSGNDVIDHGGLFIATYMIPKIGTVVRLKISLPGGYEFEANGVVRWAREQSEGGDVLPGFGAQLTQITPEARQLVYRYVRNREPLFHDDL